MQRPIVEMLLLPSKLSGKRSMHETVIIAPAEKHKKNGRYRVRTCDLSHVKRMLSLLS